MPPAPDPPALTASPTPGPAPRQGPGWLLLAVVLLGLLLSGGGSVLLYDAARRSDRQALADEATARARQLELAVELALESLNALRALHLAGLPLDAASFQRFARADAAPHRGTLALGWAPRVPAAQRAAFEQALAAELGRPEAALFEATGHGLRRAAAPRPAHYPLLHLATLEGGDFEPGLDLLSVPARRSALETAVARGRPAATKVRRADAWGSAGELVLQVFLPVPARDGPGDAPPQGVVLGVFSVSEILARVIRPDDSLRLALFDRSAPAAEQGLLAHGLPQDLRSEAAFLAEVDEPTVAREVGVADRRWVLHLLPPPGQRSYATLLWPLAGLLGGLLITGLLSVHLLLAEARGRKLLRLHRTLDQVQQRLMQEQVGAEVNRRLREQALAAARARSSFLQAASHDLRQPLHALALYLNLLGDQPERGRDPAFLAQLQHSAAALQGLFDALLDIGRLESGQIEPAPRPLALRPLLLGLVEESRGLAERKGLRLLERLAPVDAFSDPLLLERIVRNLLVNALRHTPRGGVALRCRARGDAIWLQVLDTGPGLSPAQQARLTGADGGAVAGAGPGTGLGLSIVSELARRLGHPLQVRSRPGRGSVISLVLPRAPAVAAPPAAPAPPPAAIAWPHGRVLVLDDDPEVRQATAARLRAWGAEVDEAASLTEAAATLDRLAAAGTPPGLALLDLRLPDGRGTALRPRLRDAAGRAIPRVWISAEPGADIAPPAAAEAEAGAREAVLRKPVTALKLRSAIDAVMR